MELQDIHKRARPKEPVLEGRVRKSNRECPSLDISLADNSAPKNSEVNIGEYSPSQLWSNSPPSAFPMVSPTPPSPPRLSSTSTISVKSKLSRGVEIVKDHFPGHSTSSTKHSFLNVVDIQAPEIQLAIKSNQNSGEKPSLKYSIENFGLIRSIYRVQHEDIRLNKVSSWKKSMLGSVKALDFITRIAEKKRRRMLLVFLDLIVDIIFCGLYVIEANGYVDEKGSPQVAVVPMLSIPRPLWMWYAVSVLTSFNLMSYIYRFNISTNKNEFFTSLPLLIDLVITIPFVISWFLQNGQQLYVPYFTRSWVAIGRLRQAMQFNFKRRDGSKVHINPFQQRFMLLLATVMAILFTGLCFFQIFELKFSNPDHPKAYTMFESFYFIVITISTVGYGDIAPSTLPSRIVVIVVILVALMVIPNLVKSLIEIYVEQKATGGMFERGVIPHIVFCGCFDNLTQFKNLINTFIEMEGATERFKLVFLSEVKETTEITSLIETTHLRSKVYFLQGDCVRQQDLERAQIRHAEAAFVFGNSNHPKDSEEEYNTLRCWSIHLHAPHIPLYASTVKIGSSIPKVILKKKFSSEAVLSTLFAYNCLFPGTATVILNLVHQYTPFRFYREPWQQQYGDGSLNKIYIEPLNPIFQKKSFSEIATFIFQEFQVIMIAVTVMLSDKGTLRKRKHIMLNPGRQYHFRQGDECVFISQDKTSVDAIANLTLDQFSRSLNYLVKYIHSAYTSDPSKPNYPPVPSSPFPSDFYIGLPIPPYEEIQQSVCILARNPIKSLAMCTLGNLENGVTPPRVLTDHILVFIGENWDRCFEMLCTLRNVYVTSKNCKPVLFVSIELPDESLFHCLSQFPDVYFLKGSCRDNQVLMNAGIFRCGSIIIMKQPVGESGRCADIPTIVTRQKICSLLHEKKKNIPVYVELDDESNIRFMQPFMHQTADATRDFSDIEDDSDYDSESNESEKELKNYRHEKKKISSMYLATPRRKKTMKKQSKVRVYQDYSFINDVAYASGDVILTSMIDNILYMDFHHPSIIQIILLLCGKRFKSNQKYDLLFNVEKPSHLSTMVMPISFVGLRFVDLFSYFSTKKGIICLGLKRVVDNELQELHFVYTNPLPSAICKSSDQVFVLKPSEIGKGF